MPIPPMLHRLSPVLIALVVVFQPLYSEPVLASPISSIQMSESPVITADQIHKAISSVRERKIARQIEALNLTIDMYPRDKSALFARAISYFDLGDYSRAVSDLDSAHSLAPNDPIIYRERGIAYYKLGQLAYARSDLERAVLLNPTDTLALAYQGEVAADDGRSQDAILIFGKLLKLTPDDCIILRMRARIFHNLGDDVSMQQDLDRLKACSDKPNE